MLRPRDRRGERPGALASTGRRRRRGRERQGRVRRLAEHRRSPGAWPGAVRLPRAAERAQGGDRPRSSPPSTARCSRDALGEVTRGLEVVEFACGIPHLLKGGFSEGVSTKVDVLLDPPAARRGRHHPPFNFPAMVPMWFFPIAIAAGNTVVRQAEREGPERQRTSSPSCGPRPACPPACSTSCTVTRWPSTRCWTTRTSRASRSSARPRSRGTCTSAARPAASACRPSAEPRTTWSCSPTPTSTWQPTPRSTPASAPPVSAAWRSPRWWRSATSRTR